MSLTTFDRSKNQKKLKIGVLQYTKQVSFCQTEILKKTRIVPSVVRRWGGSGGGNHAGRIGGVLAALCVSYPRPWRAQEQVQKRVKPPLKKNVETPNQFVNKMSWLNFRKKKSMTQARKRERKLLDRYN